MYMNTVPGKLSCSLLHPLLTLIIRVHNCDIMSMLPQAQFYKVLHSRVVLARGSQACAFSLASFVSKLQLKLNLPHISKRHKQQLAHQWISTIKSKRRGIIWHPSSSTSCTWSISNCSAGQEDPRRFRSTSKKQIFHTHFLTHMISWTIMNCFIMGQYNEPSSIMNENFLK